MDLETSLREETNKWLSRLEKKDLSKKEGKVEEQLVNVRAYIQDCKHFLKKGDMVHAFEAVIYAWGIYETLLRMHFIKE